MRRPQPQLVPSHGISHVPSQEDCVRALFGIEPGEWACPDCETVYQIEQYPTYKCVGCGRPFSQVCASHGCSNMIEPEKVFGDDGRHFTWYFPVSHCKACAKTEDLTSSQRVIDQALPGSLVAFSGNYHKSSLPEWEHRFELESTLRWWMGDGSWETGGWEEKPILVIHGAANSGKTVAAGAALVAAVRKRGVKSIAYQADREFGKLASASYSEDGAAELQNLRDAYLLLYDDLQERRHFTPHQRSERENLFLSRIETGRKTIVTIDSRAGRPPRGWLSEIDPVVALNSEIDPVVALKAENKVASILCSK